MEKSTWSPTKVRAAKDCLRLFDQRYNQKPGNSVAESDLSLPTSFKMGMVAHSALQAAYTAASLCQDHHRVDLMGRFIGEAIAAARGAADLPETLISEADVTRVESEVIDVLNRLPAPHPQAVLAIEEEVKGVTPAGTPLTTRIDLVLQTGPTSIHIRDWKRIALAQLGTALNLAHDDQLGAYRYVAPQRWPWAKRVTVGFYSITDNREITAEITADGALEVLRGYDSIIEKMETTTKFPAQPSSSLCWRCPVRSSCPAWRGSA